MEAACMRSPLLVVHLCCQQLLWLLCFCLRIHSQRVEGSDSHLKVSLPHLSMAALGVKFDIPLTKAEEQQAIDDFVKVVTFPTVSALGPTNGSYDECAEFLKKKCKEAGLEDVWTLGESRPNKPIVLARWRGKDPTKGQILLNSHYDVVPVQEEDWTVPAFDGLRRDGKVYGRGTQDMKCVCIQYIVAIRKLMSNGFIPERDIFLSFVPDEEIGGVDGMKILLDSEWYTTLNIELALDEGLASEDGLYSVFYGERLPWWVKVTAKGNTGHGSRFIEGTAVEQIIGVANKALSFRTEQRNLLHKNCSHTNACSHAIAASRKTTMGDVTSLNITLLRSGVRSGEVDVLNVVPPQAQLAMDIRISPHMPPEEMSGMIDTWCQEISNETTGLGADGGVSWDYNAETPLLTHNTTSTDAASNPWWETFTNALKELDIETRPEVFPAATDSRFLRALGVKAFGFSPMRNTRIMLHENDEYLEER